MSDIVRSSPGTVVSFEPRAAKANDAKANAVIDFAKRVHDWPMLTEAVAKKIEDQEEFVRWWRDNVRRAGNQPKCPDPGKLSFEKAEEFTGIKHQQVSKWTKRLKDKERYAEALYGAAYRAAMAEALNSELVQQSLSNEHYTPARYIEAAREVLGTIDLDPASCAEANEIVQATKFYAQGGLELPWAGQIWLNPPYGGFAGGFIKKLSDEYRAGRVAAAITLVNSSCTDTAWFQPLWNGVLCFTNHRINFYGDGKRSGSTHGSVFVYFGPNETKFAHEFLQFGPIVKMLLP